MERLLNLVEINLYYETLKDLREEINLSFIKYKDALYDLVNTGAIAGLVVNQLEELRDFMDYTARNNDESLDQFIRYIKQEVIDKSEETERLASNNLKLMIERMKK
ncbi:MAG: hypothetical protein HXK70_06160 [Clostridiales bacterium]|jgi:hypothetical protein|nr:hypothetical protein [Clostridiales bacterium]